MKAEIKELLERQYIGGTSVINCIPHMNIDLTERPDDCKLCLSDLRNHLLRVISINAWLNRWKDDATQILSPGKYSRY